MFSDQPLLISLLAVAGGVSSAALVFPQVARIVRTGSTAGLSDSTWLMMSLMFGSWLVWGLVSGDVFLVAVHLLGLPATLWVLWRIGRDGGVSHRRLTLSSTAAAAAISVQFLGGAAGAVVAVVALSAASRGAQLSRVIKAEDVSGVSILPWGISAVGQLFWFGYGSFTGDMVLQIHAPFSLLASALLVTAVMARRGQITMSLPRPSLGALLSAARLQPAPSST